MTNPNDGPPAATTIFPGFAFRHSGRTYGPYATQEGAELAQDQVLQDSLHNLSQDWGLRNIRTGEVLQVSEETAAGGISPRKGWELVRRQVTAWEVQ